MKRITIFAGLAAVLLVIVMLVLFLRPDPLKARSLNILERCRDGEARQVWLSGSPPFRKLISWEEFQSFLSYRAATLGAFQELSGVADSRRYTKDDLDLGEITLSLRYEKGETQGSFVFVEVGDHWELISMSILVPSELAPPPDKSRLEPAAREVIRHYNAGTLPRIYETFSPQLRMKLSEEKFKDHIGRFREAYGTVKSSKLTTSSDKGVEILEFELELEKKRGHLVLRYIWFNGGWSILGFRMIVDE